jgi:site-specific DNA-methyltransferase (adenine-specific)
LVDPFGKYKLNYFQGDTLKIDIQCEFKLEGFDLVVGNPPYNDELKSTGASPIYHLFIYKYQPLCKSLQFIIPSRWFAGGKGLDQFRRWMQDRKDIVYIKHYNNSKEVFGKIVDIKGGVGHFMIDKNYNGMCNFNNESVKLDKYDIVVQDPKYYKLIDKVKAHESIINIYKGRNYGIESNDKRLVDKKSSGNILVYVSKQKGYKKYIDKKFMNAPVNTWKVITAEASHTSGSSFGNTFIGKPNECHTGSYISFNVKNSNEADSLLTYLKCKLPNLLLSIRKISQHISADTCKWIPLVPLDKNWTDQLLFEYFEFDEELIGLVNNIKIIGWK